MVDRSSIRLPFPRVDSTCDCEIEISSEPPAPCDAAWLAGWYALPTATMLPAWVAETLTLPADETVAPIAVLVTLTLTMVTDSPR